MPWLLSYVKQFWWYCHNTCRSLSRGLSKPLESSHSILYLAVKNHATAEYVLKITMKVLPFLFFLLLRHKTQGKLIRGHLISGDNWKFLARFCFLSMHGKFEYDIIYDASYGVQNIDLYYDTKYQWARVYGSTADLTTCSEKESVLKVKLNNLSVMKIFCKMHEFRYFWNTVQFW